MVNLDKLWEIADRYNTSKPVSGNWDTETEHQLNATAKELGISKQEAKQLMIDELGFPEEEFKNIKSSFTPEKIRNELGGYDIDPEPFLNIEFDVNEEDISAFASSWYVNMMGDPKNVKKVEYDSSVDGTDEKLYNSDKEYNFDGAYIITYNDGSTRRYGWYYGQDDLIRLADKINSSRQIKSSLDKVEPVTPPRSIPHELPPHNNEPVKEEKKTDEDGKSFKDYLDEARKNASSSRKPIKSCFVIEHWHPLFQQTHYVGYTTEGLASVYDIDDALQFNTEEEAKRFIKEHDETYGGKLKIHEYPSYVRNSRKITSARYIATDPESGEVLGSADTYEEAVNEWGEDVTITDSEVAEGEENMDAGLFSNKKVIKSSNLPEEVYYIIINGSKQYYNTYEEAEKDLEYLIQYGKSTTVGGVYTETDPEEIAELVEVGYIKSSKKPNGDKAFLSNIVSSVSTNNMTEEQAIKRIALRNNCNEGFARNILSEALNDETLISSGVMEIADDINKEFDIDGNIDSWLKAYMKDEGKSNTVGGEILRAFAKIRYRYYNDGDMIGRGYGKETVNPAARYLYEHVLDSSTADIEEMLNGESDINSSPETYEDWLEGYEGSLENYLRNNEELFHTPNKEDMLDYRTEEDKDSSVTECYIEDSYGNTYWFENEGGDGNWKCYQIDFGTDAEFEVGDVVNSSQIEQYVDIDEDSDYVDFANDGLYYSAERYGDDEWEITNIELESGLANEGDYWSVDDLMREDVFDSNGNSLSENDLY